MVTNYNIFYSLVDIPTTSLVKHVCGANEVIRIKRDICSLFGNDSRVLTDTHPDVKIFQRGEDENSLGINAVREIKTHINKAPIESSVKFIILPEADRLTMEAASLLLKEVEEPYSNIKFIFLTANEDQLLSTLRSRCIEFYLQPLTKKEVRQILEELGLTENVSLISNLAHGNISLAKKLPEYLPIRKDLLNVLLYGGSTYRVFSNTDLDVEVLDCFVKSLILDILSTQEIINTDLHEIIVDSRKNVNHKKLLDKYQRFHKEYQHRYLNSINFHLRTSLLG